MAVEEAKLVQWCIDNKLQRHVELLTDPHGDIGLACLQDLMDMNPAELRVVAERLGMNLGEQKRFFRAVAELSGQDPDSESRMQEQESAAVAPKAPRGFSAMLIKSGLESQVAPKARAPPDKQKVREAAARACQPTEWEVQDRIFCALQTAPANVDLYTVLKGMVFVMAQPDKDSQRLGIVMFGHVLQAKKNTILGTNGARWVELTYIEVVSSVSETDLKVIDIANPELRGYCLIDGTHIGLGPLLRGPIPRDLIPTGCPEEEAINCLKNWEAQQPRSIEEQRQQEEVKHEQELQHQGQKDGDILKKEFLAMELGSAKRSLLTKMRNRSLKQKVAIGIRQAANPVDEEVIKNSVAYRTCSNFILAKMNTDPTSEKIRRIPCEPGETLYATGEEWTGPQGGVWVKTHASSPRWVMTHAPNTEPLLMLASSTKDFVRIGIDLVHESGDVRIHETLMSADKEVSDLIHRLCVEGQLRPRAIYLFRKKQDVSTPTSVRDMVHPGSKIRHHIDEEGLTFFLYYCGDFEKEYKGGEALRKTLEKQKQEGGYDSQEDDDGA